MVLLAIGLGVAFKAYPQPRVAIPEVAGCVNEKLLVPVYVDDFNDIEAFTLHVVVDTTKVAFIDVEQAHEALSSGALLSNLQDNGQPVISVVWVGNSAVNLHDTALFYLHLKLLGSQADFEFSEDSELVLSDYTLAEETVFSGGQLKQWDDLNPALSDSSLSEGQSVNISLPGLYGMQYQWQITSGDEWINLNDNSLYEGTSSETLSVQDVTDEMRNKAFRCILSAGSCTDLSGEVMLKFAPLAIDEGDGVNNSFVRFYPNPVAERLYCRVWSHIEGATVSIYNTHGQRMKHWNTGELEPGQVVEFAVSDLNTGLFTVRFQSQNHYMATHKILINH